VSARVIRGKAAADAPKSRARQVFVPTAKKIAKDRFDAEIEREQTMNEARMRARAIAEEARKVAHEEGRSEGHARAAAVLARAQIERDEVVDRSIDVVVAAARAVSERALGQTLAIDDAALASWAREALASLKHARRMTVRGSKKNVERLATRLHDIAPGARDAIELVVDDAIADDTILARSEVGEVTLELHTQIDALLAAVRDTVASAVRGRVG